MIKGAGHIIHMWKIIAKCKGKEQLNADRPALNGGPFGGPSAGQPQIILGQKYGFSVVLSKAEK